MFKDISSNIQVSVTTTKNVWNVSNPNDVNELRNILTVGSFITNKVKEEDIDSITEYSFQITYIDNDVVVIGDIHGNEDCFTWDTFSGFGCHSDLVWINHLEPKKEFKVNNDDINYEFLYTSSDVIVFRDKDTRFSNSYVIHRTQLREFSTK